jgi:hypothetical protein
MSYSITKRAASKQALKDAAEKDIQAFVANQKCHADNDLPAIRAAISGFIDSLSEPKEGEEVVLECSGSTGGSWSNAGGLERATSNSINIRVYHAHVPASPQSE